MSCDTHVRGLVRRFGPTAVLDGLDLDVPAGAFIALLGRSGSGKTTLLRTLAGLDTAEQGVVNLPPRRAVVFQEPRLMPWLTVAGNVAFGLRYMPKTERGLAVQEALDVVGLAAAANLLPKQLSGGMAQRVALARALAPRPKLLLLDEPFSALDPFTREQMQDHLTHLHAHYGATMVLITHDMDEALALAHRVIVVSGPPGLITDDFKPDLERPADRTSTEFFVWKRRLTERLSNRRPVPEYA
jgi:sulfonate transport system ATP-binding protein